MSRADLLHTPASMPGLVLRLLSFAVAVLSALVLIPFPLWQAGVALLALVGALSPHTFGTWMAAASLPLGMLFSDVDAGRASLAVLAVSLLHVLGTLSQQIRMRARVVLRALMPSVKRLVAVQVPTQALMLLVLVLVPAASGQGQAWVAMLGGAAVVLITVVLLRAMRRPGVN